MSHRWAYPSVLAILVLALLPVAAQAGVSYDVTTPNAWQSGLLYTHFGVTLDLMDTPSTYDLYPGVDYYGFDLKSFKPTKNINTADFYVEDWYGAWDTQGRAWHYYDYYTFRTDAPGNFNRNDPTTYANGWPYGAEIYDAEAIYFDNDNDNLYIAVVTSYDPPPGRKEYNWGWSGGVQGFSGDLALEIPAQTGDFQYLFGVNWNNENRTGDGGQGTQVGSPAYDDGVYKTDTSLWYNPAGANINNPKPSNFDQDYDVNGSNLGGTPTYLARANVSFYKWFFYKTDADGKKTEILENMYDTYVYEATIPKSALANYSSLQDETNLRLHWGMSCGNDYGESFADCDVTIGQPPVTPEASTLVLLCASLAVGGLFRRRSFKTPSGDA